MTNQKKQIENSENTNSPHNQIDISHNIADEDTPKRKHLSKSDEYNSLFKSPGVISKFYIEIFDHVFTGTNTNSTTNNSVSNSINNILTLHRSSVNNSTYKLLLCDFYKYALSNNMTKKLVSYIKETMHLYKIEVVGEVKEILYKLLARERIDIDGTGTPKTSLLSVVVNAASNKPQVISDQCKSLNDPNTKVVREGIELSREERIELIESGDLTKIYIGLSNLSGNTTDSASSTDSASPINSTSTTNISGDISVFVVPLLSVPSVINSELILSDILSLPVNIPSDSLFSVLFTRGKLDDLGRKILQKIYDNSSTIEGVTAEGSTTEGTNTNNSNNNSVRMNNDRLIQMALLNPTDYVLSEIYKISPTLQPKREEIVKNLLEELREIYDEEKFTKIVEYINGNTGRDINNTISTNNTGISTNNTGISTNNTGISTNNTGISISTNSNSTIFLSYSNTLVASFFSKPCSHIFTTFLLDNLEISTLSEEDFTKFFYTLLKKNEDAGIEYLRKKKGEIEKKQRRLIKQWSKSKKIRRILTRIGLDI